MLFYTRKVVLSVSMYEFLAPWGVLIPLFSAVLVYVRVAEKRRKEMMEDFGMFLPGSGLGRVGPSTGLFVPLSWSHG